MKTAGLVLDFYDDPRGELLKSTFPTVNDLPGVVKTAHILAPEERDVLRDDAFALILQNEGKQLRKFACVDEGNLVLSTVYFRENADKLPAEAIKVAAMNLIAFHESFDLEVPDDLIVAAETGMPSYEKTAYTLGEVHGVMGGGGAVLGAAKGLIAPGKNPDGSKKSRLGGAAKGALKGGVIGNLAAAGTVAGTNGVREAGKIYGDVAKAGFDKAKGIFTKKAASGMARKRDGFKEAMPSEDGDWAQRTNLLPVRGGLDSGKVMQSITAQAAKVASADESKGVGNHAAVGAAGGAAAGGALAAAGGSLYERVKLERGIRPFEKMTGKMPANVRKPMMQAVMKGGAKKWAGRGAVAGAAVGAGALATRKLMKNRQEASTTKAASINNVVDISGLDPEIQVMKKTAHVTALGTRYALDSYSDVQDAVQFFGECWAGLKPQERHEFAVKTAARATELGIEVPELMERYGSTSYATDVEAHLASRRAVAPDVAGVYTALQEKVASIEPEVFAATLAKLDERHNLDFYWGGELCDPWYATFGPREKTASAIWESGTGDSVTAEQLQALGADKVGSQFDPEFTSAFMEDPVAIFQSMPDSTKTLLARLAQ